MTRVGGRIRRTAATAKIFRERYKSSLLTIGQLKNSQCSLTYMLNHEQKLLHAVVVKAGLAKIHAQPVKITTHESAGNGTSFTATRVPSII